MRNCYADGSLMDCDACSCTRVRIETVAANGTVDAAAAGVTLSERSDLVHSQDMLSLQSTTGRSKSFSLSFILFFGDPKSLKLRISGRRKCGFRHLEDQHRCFLCLLGWVGSKKCLKL